jgi:NitT/TauT family transport system substrate-binding protein
MINRRIFALGLGSLGFATLAPAQAAGTKINISYTPANSFLPAFVAQEEGLFAKHGIDANLQVVNTPTIAGALRGGSVDIGAVTPPALLQGNENGLDLVAVCGVSIQSKSNATISVVVRKDSGIKSAADFKGKIVAVPGINSIIDVVFRKWLKDKGVDPSTVQIREMNFPTMQDQLAAKGIDAATAVEPFRDRIIKSGVADRFADFFGDVRDNSAEVYWLSTREWAQAHPQDIKNFRAAMADGIAFIHTNPPRARAIEIKYLKLSSPKFATYTTDLRLADLVFYSDLGHEVGLLKQHPDVSTYLYH